MAILPITWSIIKVQLWLNPLSCLFWRLKTMHFVNVICPNFQLVIEKIAHYRKTNRLTFDGIPSWSPIYRNSLSVWIKAEKKTQEMRFLQRTISTMISPRLSVAHRTGTQSRTVFGHLLSTDHQNNVTVPCPWLSIADTQIGMMFNVFKTVKMWIISKAFLLLLWPAILLGDLWLQWPKLILSKLPNIHY